MTRWYGIRFMFMYVYLERFAYVHILLWIYVHIIMLVHRKAPYEISFSDKMGNEYQ